MWENTGELLLCAGAVASTANVAIYKNLTLRLMWLALAALLLAQVTV